MFFRNTLLLLGMVSSCFGAGKMDQLLNTYKTESELSQITKSESAGFVDIYTREDLEKMQARTLMDIYKLFTIPNVSRTSNNVAYFTKPTNNSMPNSAIRLYINDHDMAASSYGSDALMWSNMSLDHIDHIVVYKSSSSIEFGNEPGTVIVKLYTKQAEREEGGKVRAMIDQKGSHTLNAYFGHTTRQGLSYLFYASTENEKRDKYYNQNSELNSDQTNENIYANLFYKNWRFEAAHYKKQTNSFLGLGKEHTPSGGDGLDSIHNYLHLTKKFDNNLKLQIAYDILNFDANYYDANGIYAGSAGFVKSYNMNYKDKVLSLICDKIFYFGKNKLLVGGFYKKKDSTHSGHFDTTLSSFTNTLNLYSLYAEESYSFNPTTMFVASLKTDFYNYDKDVKSQTEYIARAGFIKNISKFQIKAFYTKTYYAAPMAYLYSNGENVPYKTNPDLDYTEPTLLTLGVKYKNKHHEIDLRAASIKVKNKIAYDSTKGFYNIDEKRYEQYELKYTYIIDTQNKISFDIYTGDNADTINMSPSAGGHIIAYNTYKKFDFYNELDYRNSYELYGIKADDSYNFTSAVKYHYSKDLSFGFKGENIFNKSFQQIYNGVEEPIEVFDQKFWLNMEYLF